MSANLFSITFHGREALFIVLDLLILHKNALSFDGIILFGNEFNDSNNSQFYFLHI